MECRSFVQYTVQRVRFLLEQFFEPQILCFKLDQICVRRERARDKHREEQLPHGEKRDGVSLPL
jgi:hypothetical protein